MNCVIGQKSTFLYLTFNFLKQSTNILRIYTEEVILKRRLSSYYKTYFSSCNLMEFMMDITKRSI